MAAVTGQHLDWQNITVLLADNHEQPVILTYDLFHVLEFSDGSIIHVFEMLLAVIDININNIIGDAMKMEQLQSRCAILLRGALSIYPRAGTGKGS